MTAMANPYPGLRPFRADEAAMFAGRELATENLRTRVRVSPLTIMFARSGVGKSSFLTCRLIPALRESSIVEYLNEWGGMAPERLIGRRLDNLLGSGGEGTAARREEPVLVLDQFEDVFKLTRNRKPLWDQLAEIVHVPDIPVRVVVSMREEWLGAWEESSDYLYGADTLMVRLGPLTDKELTRAILKPAAQEGSVTVEPGLVPELLADLEQPSAFGLGDGYVEPGLLQLVCRRLWTEASTRSNRSMSLELYTSLGRSDQIIREFVWNHLGKAGAASSNLSVPDRVLWVGLTRHLVVARGVKAIVTPQSLARKLRVDDLGLAGSAVAQDAASPIARQYLETTPETRGTPPSEVVTWISNVLSKGAAVGLLKQQRGLRDQRRDDGNESSDENLFELAHDTLGDVLQQFAVEFESWLRFRWYMLCGILAGAIFGLPAIVAAIAAGLGIKELLIFLVAGAAYVFFIWLANIVGKMLYRLIAYPIIRRLARGEIPLPKRPGAAMPRSARQDAPTA